MGDVARFVSARAVRAVAVAAAATATIAMVVAGPAAGEDAASPTTTVAPTTTARPATTAPATTVPLPSLPPPADEASDPVAALVPNIVALMEPTSDADRDAAIATALTEQRNSVATEASPATLCAVVAVAAPLMAEGRWELDGEPLASTPEVRRDPPGYGDCLDGERFDGFDDGAYQYVVVGPSGARSAVATFVVGVPSVVVWLLNDGEQPVCLVQASPEPADRFDSFASDSELLPGEAMAVRVAAVEQDIRVFGCPADDVVRSFELDPQFGVYVALIGGDAPESSVPSPAPAGSATSTTVRPTTTG